MTRPILGQTKIEGTDVEYTVTLYGPKPGGKKHEVVMEKTKGELTWADKLGWKLWFMSEDPAWAEFHAQVNAYIQGFEKRGEIAKLTHTVGAKPDNDDNDEVGV
jgi:hypothetical protein